MTPKLILISKTMLLIFLATPCTSNLGQIQPTSEVLPPEIDNISSDEPIQEKLPIEGATSTATPLPYPQTVQVKEAGIVRLDYHLGKTPIEVIEESGAELLPPPLTKERN